VEAIRPQVNQIFIIDNASNPPVDVPDTFIIKDPQQPPNLSALWNLGLDAIEAYIVYSDDGGYEEYDHWDVAILNDDALPYPGWMEQVCDAMRNTTAIAGCTMSNVPSPIVYGPDTGPAISTRVTGWAFVLRGEGGVRFDEDFVWWCGDDDISEYARKNGGLVVVPGPEVPNLLANSTTVGANLAQSAMDMQHYVDKHGRRPW
jgi:hypothetical protein